MNLFWAVWEVCFFKSGTPPKFGCPNCCALFSFGLGFTLQQMVCFKQRASGLDFLAPYSIDFFKYRHVNQTWPFKMGRIFG